jgi:DNA-binding transcriptional MerR regulator
MSGRKESFSTSEAARLTGVPHRTVDYWAKTKLIAPSIADANGIGTDRLYDFSDLVALRVAHHLRKAGISTQALRKALGRLRELRNPLVESRILAIGSSVVWVKTSDEVIDVLTGQGTFAFMLDFPRTVREVKTKIEKDQAA